MKHADGLENCVKTLQANGIEALIAVGGDDTMRVAAKLHEMKVKIIGVPKTIDNDLPHTDNCPGYGSVIKYNAATVMEVGMDVGSMATDDGSCCIIEVMGRSAGWIAAGTVLAKRGNPANPPHIILPPELPFEEEKISIMVSLSTDSDLVYPGRSAFVLSDIRSNTPLSP